MKTTTWFACTIVLVFAANANAQVLPRFITLNPGKASVPPRASQRAASPLNSAALLAAVKTSTKASSAVTTDYVTLTASQPYVNSKGMLTVAGGTLMPGANGGAITLRGAPMPASLTIYITPSSGAKTYLIDISAIVQAGESVQTIGPDGSVVKTTYATAGEQHLLFMVTPQNVDVQHIGIIPSKLFTFYSCKVSVLK